MAKTRGGSIGRQPVQREEGSIIRGSQGGRIIGSRVDSFSSYAFGSSDLPVLRPHGGSFSIKVFEVDVKVEEPGENNVHNNAFYAEEKLLRSELEAMCDCNSLSAPHWVIRNTRTVNRTGQLTGYKLLPGSNCLPLAGAEAKVLRRAAFLKHNIWVTPYARDEMFLGGEFLNQNPRVGEGLATWVQQNRSLEETDVVLWYVFGMTHVPRLEDWPIMPVEHIRFMLMLLL